MPTAPDAASSSVDDRNSAENLPSGVPASGDDAVRASAIRVLAMEADALHALAAGLDDSFDRAVGMLLAATGRVIVTGMGKSGHIARKIAATLASTGTPAFFVHPAEASHGDLGMIAHNDVVIALSNSGETAELDVVIAYLKRHVIPLIGMTRRAGSALAERSDLTLLIPAAPEACPLGLAPTTSTTMMLALGDALAVALLERRGFTAADFRQLHPGGNLGHRLLMVGDIMHKGEAMPLCRADTPAPEVIFEMTGKRLGCVGVVDDAGCLMGIVTDGDLRRHLSADLMTASASTLMSSRPKTIRPRALVEEALAAMNQRQITSLFVVEGDRPVGVVHIHDCLRSGAG